MSLVTPQLPIINPFDATQPYTINFVVSGGDQVVSNTLTIYNNSTNAVVTTITTTSLILSATINANTLVNGTFYKCTITTQNSLAQSSSPSSAVVFLPLSPAVITVTNITSGKVYNQNVTFSAIYTQTQSELLQQYTYYLYDNNKNLLQTYPVQYTSVSPLTQLISNLNNNVVYYVRILSISINGQNSDSGYIQFTPSYITPLLNSTLTAQNIPSTGSILISANVVQLLGTPIYGSAWLDTAGVDDATTFDLSMTFDDTLDASILFNNFFGTNLSSYSLYTNTTWVDLSNSQINYNTGFNLNQDNFVLKIWCENIPSDVTFLTLTSTYGHIDFQIDSNQLHAWRYNNGSTIVAHFVSNTLIIGNNVPFLVYIRSVGGLMDLSLTLV